MTLRAKKIMTVIKSIEELREEALEKHKLIKKQKNSTVAKFATTQNEKESQEIENTEEKIKQDTGKKQLKAYRIVISQFSRYRNIQLSQ